MFNTLAAVVNLGSSYVAIIDLVLLAVLLFSLIFGAIKGFLGQILSILGSVASIVLAVMLCDKIADFIMNSMPSLVEWLNDKIGELFGLTDELLSGTKEEILELLASTNIPAFLHEILANAIIETAGELDIINVLSRWAIVAISFVLIFIVTRIIFAIIKSIFKGLTKISIIGALDRILGAILMALKFLIAATLIITLLSVFMDMNSILAPTLEDGTVVNSIFNSFVSWIMQLDFIQNMIIA